MFGGNAYEVAMIQHIPSLFFLLQRNGFPLRLRYQTSVTMLRYLRSSAFYREPVLTTYLTNVTDVMSLTPSFSFIWLWAWELGWSQCPWGLGGGHHFVCLEILVLQQGCSSKVNCITSFKSLQKFFSWLHWRQIPKKWNLKILILKLE